jgi:hypothetical protein
LGKPPAGEAIKRYERLRFTGLSAEDARDAVNMLLVPASEWGAAAFNSADADGSGEVDFDELKKALVSLGMEKISDAEVGLVRVENAVVSEL